MYFQCYIFFSVLVANCAITCCYIEPCVSVAMQYLVDSLKLFEQTYFELPISSYKVSYF